MLRELLLSVLLVLVPPAFCYEQFCRCQCAGAYEIRPLNCADCSKRACAEYDICKGSEPESAIAECFQRESLKDKLVVVSFLLLTASLLAYSFRRARH